MEYTRSNNFTRKTFFTIFCIAALSSSANAKMLSGKQKTDFENSVKQSLVYLNITSNTYSTVQPWKKSEVVERTGYGCAVAPYQIITTASNVRDASYIKLRCYGQNEFITAEIKVVDYESNLCLLTLDKAAMEKPLIPIKFTEKFEEDAEAVSYWLAAGSTLKTGRGVIDRAEINLSATSFAKFLDYVIANAPSGSNNGKLYCLEKNAIGINCWSNNGSKEAGVIPGVTINRFLKDAADGDYKGFASVGFAAKRIIDPATRKFLKMPAKMKGGIYVSKVYTIGTGSKELIEGDMILSINGHDLDAYGKYEHTVYEKIYFHNIITSFSDGDELDFVVWRDGKKEEIMVAAKKINADDMLVDYYEYDKQPEYVITGGFVIQKLTRPYLMVWGEDMEGNAPPHLYHYYRDMGFNAIDERKDIVVLSIVIPSNINLGYHSMGRQVITKFNGMEISCIEDILQAQKLNAPARYDIIEFEHDYPKVVIDRSMLSAEDAFIAQTYGIQNLVNINK